jgi:putative heme-binding domain-containing protein
MRRRLVIGLLMVTCGPTSAVAAQAAAGGPGDSQPVAIWPAGPLELVLAFPRGMDPVWAKSFEGRTVAFDDAKPPAGAPLGTLRIAAAHLADKGRTLLLATDPHPWVATYRFVADGAEPNRLAFQYDLSGVEVAWTEGDGNNQDTPAWKGWWPALDLDVTRRLVRGSVPHERCFGLLEKPGRLVLSTLLTLPVGELTVRIEAGGTLSDVTLGEEQVDDAAGSIEMKLRSRGEPVFLSLTVATGQKGRHPLVRASYSADDQGKSLPIGRQMLLLPWAPIRPSDRAAAPVPVRALTGGDAGRGEALFFGEQGRCAQCHAFRGRGATIGPDLTEIARKGKESIYRSIAAPSSEIAPQYIPYTVATRDGRVLAGLVRAAGPDEIRITDINAKTTSVRRDHIDQIRPSGTSIMPVGLVGGLGEAAVRDLIAFLIKP